MSQKTSEIFNQESDRPTDAGYTVAMFRAMKRSLLNDLARILLNEIERMEEVASGKRTLNFYEEVENFERSLIEQALSTARGNQTKVARMLGMKKCTLNDKIRVYNISMKQFVGTHPLIAFSHDRLKTQNLDDQPTT